MSKSILHESVIGVLASVGVKPRGHFVEPANNTGFLREQDGDATLGKKPAIVVSIVGHPVMTECSWDAATMAEGREKAFAVCRKANGYPIFEEKEGKLNVRFTKDAAKATVKEAAELAKLVEAKTDDDEDETDGTGEASGDTTTSQKVKNKEGVKAKAGTKVVAGDTKGGEDTKADAVGEAVKDPKTGEKVELFKPGKAAELKEKIAKAKKLGSKKDKTADEKKEESELNAEIDAICESFYDSLRHPVTFVLYKDGEAEIHGLTEEEIAPFGGTAPMVPAKYAKKAAEAGPNSKVDMGVLTLYKTRILYREGRDPGRSRFQGCGFGTPGKGYGKQAAGRTRARCPWTARRTSRLASRSNERQSRPGSG